MKEDQIRQEMEIVKKSLEKKSLFDFAKNLSSASELLALVQASIQPSSVPQTQVADVTPTTSHQPRSFGDPQEHIEPRKAQPDFQNNNPIPTLGSPSYNQDSNVKDPYHATSQPAPYQNQPNVQMQPPQGHYNNFAPSGNQSNFNPVPNRNMQYDQAPSYQDNYDTRGNYNNQGSRGNYNDGTQHNNCFHRQNAGQQFGNRPPFGNNFRSRGRGGRGRGRGYY